ncbi:MAG TPA: G8 domain-containing protein [Cellvibrionaceae bacterium]
MPVMNNAGTHHNHASMMAEHAAFLDLVAYEEATHAAVNDGDWCNPNTWHNLSVPGDNARVVIPSDIEVVYNQVDDSRLHTVRVDGSLVFASNTSSRMIVDTLAVDPRGSLIIGSENNPVSNAAKVEIIIADNGDIDVDWDPLLLSRGLILHGTTQIHGATKTAHGKVAVDPRAGDITLQMSRSPSNWRVGDTLVIAGSRFSGWKWDNSIRDVRYHGTQDEVRTIAAISGRQVTLDRPLNHNHISPRTDLKVSVGNFSRNVVIASENADTLPPHRRGHVMFMHSDKVDVRYAEFFELGRTDKSRTNMEATDLSTAHANSNVRGRYSFHFHRSGTSNQRNPAMAIGNAVFGSPGWGYVHHDSHAMLHQNVSFNTFGAGFVAETGNETGAWTDNFAIKAEGVSGAFNPKNNNDIFSFDIARSGDGFWFQGRMVASIGNIAASVNRGFTYFHRDHSGTMIGMPPNLFMLPEALGLSGTVGADDVPIRHFHDNEAFASTVGVYVVKANPDQDHDIYTVMSNFTAWEVRAGAAIEYTAHYLLRDFDLIGNTPEPFRSPAFGIEFGTNTTDMVVRDSRIENFPVGIGLHKDHTSGNNTGVDQFVVIGGEMIAVSTPYEERDDTDLIIPSSDLVPNRFTIELLQNDTDNAFEYLNPATVAGTSIGFYGTKTDSIGTSPLPAGNDHLGIGSQDMIALVSQKGYYRTSDDVAYAVIEEYFSDRATGDIHLRSLKTRLGPDVEERLGNQFHAWRDARYLGLIDLDNQPPQAQDNSASTPSNTEVRIQVLNNDSDPENDTLRINGIVAPLYGQVFNNGSSITYRPYFGFRGTDRFHYWVSDGQGNFDRALVEVTVH